MKMTRQHFQLIADVLYQTKPPNNNMRLLDSSVKYESGGMSTLWLTGGYDTWRFVCSSFAAHLSSTNGMFNKEKFLDACGYNDTDS